MTSRTFSRRAGVALAALIAASPAFPQVPQSVSFESGPDGRAAFVDYGFGEQVLPPHPNLNATDAFMVNVWGTQRPAGASTQWITFDLRMVNMPATAHLAVALRWQGTSQWNRGHGLIVGYSGRGCNSMHPAAQTETWWNHGNHVYPDCSDFMFGSVDYSVSIHVADGGHISWQIRFKTSGELVASSYQHVTENADSGIDSLTGIAFALVFAGPGEYAVEFTNINTGWF